MKNASDFDVIVLPEDQKIDLSKLRSEDAGFIRSRHRLVVALHEQTKLRVWSALVARHQDIVEDEHIDPSTIVGGGLMYVDGDTLFVMGESGKYRALPVIIQRKIADKIILYLRMCELELSGIRVNKTDNSYPLNEFWHSVVYTR